MKTIKAKTSVSGQPKFRNFIEYKDYYIYENTLVKLNDIQDNGVEIPYNLGIEDVFIDNLYTHVLYTKDITRHLYLQKIINSNKFEETSEYSTIGCKTFVNYIDFETTIKNIKIESGKMALYLTEPNIIRLKIIELNKENIEMPCDKFLYLLRIIEYKPVDII